MPPTQIDTKDTVLQSLSSHAFAQATAKARMAGESVLISKPQGFAKRKDVSRWAALLQPQSDPGSPPPQAPPLPTQLGPFNTGVITFDNGVPVGGWMSLAIFQDGSYSFTGHFRDSGFPSYDVDGVWVIVSTSGKAFTFEVKGSTHGTLEAGSRNYDFAENGKNDAIREAWPDLCDGYHWRWSAYVNWNVQAAVDDVVSALKSAGAVIGAVVAVVAIL
jgi:hypothetical protein